MNTYAEYKALNKLARQNGVVLMGTATMSALRFNELLSDYELDCRIYNRSGKDLTAASAIEFYRKNVAEACPATLIVGIGENEESDDAVTAEQFEASMAAFVAFVKSVGPQMRVILSEIPEQSDKARALNSVLRNVSRKYHLDFAALSRTDTSLTLRYFKSLKPYLFKQRPSFADAFAYAGI